MDFSLAVVVSIIVRGMTLWLAVLLGLFSILLLNLNMDDSRDEK